jgi:hypothetical protein
MSSSSSFRGFAQWAAVLIGAGNGVSGSSDELLCFQAAFSTTEQQLQCDSDTSGSQ